MQTSTSFDWQVFEEKDWEHAVASGLLTGIKAGGQATTTTDDIRLDNTSRIAYLPWFSLAGLAVAVIFLWMAYVPWSAQRVDAMSLDEGAASMTPRVQVEVKEGHLRFSPVDPATSDPQRLTILSHYFQFSYNAHDRQAVTAAATQIDPLYGALRRSIGLGEPAGVVKIDITPRAMTTGWQLSVDSVLIPSPDFLQAPDETPAETLFQSLHMALPNIVLTERLAGAPARPKWNFLIDGLRKWLQACFDTQGERQCGGRRPASTVLGATPPMSLADLTFTDSEQVAATWRTERILAAEALVAYIVDVYGVEKLPVMLEGLRHHDKWQTLIPAVFGLSLEQFQQEWDDAGQGRQTTAH